MSLHTLLTLEATQSKEGKDQKPVLSTIPLRSFRLSKVESQSF